LRARGLALQAEAHAAAVVQSRQSERLVPQLALAWRLPELRQVLRRCLNRGAVHKHPVPRAPASRSRGRGEANLDRGALTLIVVKV